jgi:hypothetical protein
VVSHLTSALSVEDPENGAAAYECLLFADNLQALAAPPGHRVLAACGFFAKLQADKVPTTQETT